MRLPPHPLRTRRRVALGLTTVTLIGGLSAVSAASSAASASPAPRFVTLAGSRLTAAGHRIGSYSSSRMSIEVSLAPSHPAALASDLRAAYTKGSRGYHRWMRRGQFDATFAPSAGERAAVARYLRGQGLSVSRGASPFLIRATGSSGRIETAFRTSLSRFRGRPGVGYFANSTAVHLPATIAGGVLGVIGLTNTIREHPAALPLTRGRAAARTRSGHRARCEASYPSTAELFAFADNGTSFPFGYGGGPDCSGLTPSQIDSIYNAPHAGPRGRGAGVTEAVFEQGGYLRSDIATWTNTFYGSSYTPPLADRTVDGGPLNPQCPTGDTCPPSFNGYAADLEVNLDIETALAVAPDLQQLIVYNAPGDLTGQTALDEYTAMANDDTAATISSSYGTCENDITAAYAQSENVVFEQMALQGQSMFNAAGDTGAFTCLLTDGSNRVNMADPAAQPWVTSVGGTSLESDNPGTNPHPAYPRGAETVWNTDNLCSEQPPAPSNDNKGGFFWCARSVSQAGAGGGGPSQWWGRPFYQVGPGVNSQYSTFGNGSTDCALASIGTPCRETPDVSADADIFTGLAEYCTGPANTNSWCHSLLGGQPLPGWFEVGGTSQSTPIWTSIIADRDSYTGLRTGNINPLVYMLFNLAPRKYFHDITGVGRAQQAATSNGLFPTTPGYDMATGIGTPNMTALITQSGF